MDLHFTRMLVPITIVLLLIHGAIFSNAADSGKDKDKEECTEQLVGLATCLPYVGGQAKAPTPDCCNGLKQVLKTNKKCLCVIIEDRNDPDLGLSINVDLALGLPTVCNAPANVSQCPALLNLPPNSPDAQVFNQYKQASSNSTKTPASSPEATVKDNTTTTSTGKEKSSGISDGRKGVFGLFSNVVGGLLLCFWTSHLFV